MSISKYSLKQQNSETSRKVNRLVEKSDIYSIEIPSQMMAIAQVSLMNYTSGRPSIVV